MLRMSHIVIVILFLVVGSACTNLTPKVEIENYSSTVPGLKKIKVAVVVTDELSNRVKEIEVYGKCQSGVGKKAKYKKGVMRSSVNIGSAISGIVKNEFGQLFDLVDIYDKKSKINKELYDIIIVADFVASTSYDQHQASSRVEVGTFPDLTNYNAWKKRNCFETSSKIILEASIYNSKNGQLINTLHSPYTYTDDFCFGRCCNGEKGGVKKYDLLGENFAKLFALAINKSFPQLLSQLENNLSILANTKYENHTLPSSLAINLIYSEDSSFSINNILNSAENCSIIATIKNEGRGTAFDVTLVSDSQFSNINFPNSISVGNIQPGETKEVTIPLTANLNLLTGTATFRIIAKEKRGYDSKTYNLNIQTAALKKPQLSIARYKINDGNTGLASGNGNGIPENGETIELIPFVKNDGVGRAIKVTLALDINNSDLEMVRQKMEIAEIMPGQTATGKLAFTIPRTYSGGELKINLTASDVRGASNASKLVSLSTQSNRPMLAYSYRIIDHNGDNFMENGEEGEIEITLANNGQMVARDVTIKLSSADLTLTKSRDEISRLAAGSKYTPLRFPFRIPRTLEKEAVDVRLHFDQNDFPGLTDNIHIPLRLVRPEFAISHQILDPNNNGIIEQGESVDLLVRIKNTGGLDAGNVKLTIDFDKDGVVYSGKKTVDIGRIAAGQTSNGQTFTLNVTRRTTPGSLPIYFTVSQKDFSDKQLSLALNVAEEEAEVITVAGQKQPQRRAPVTAMVSSGMAPMIFIAMPQDQKRVASPFETVAGVVGDDRGVANIEVRLNGRKIYTTRGIGITASGTGQRKRNFNLNIPLVIGKNVIEITAFDIENLSSTETLTIFREAEKGEIYAAVIGINDYRHVPNLKYASKDAQAFARYMRENMGLDSDHLFELYDSQATMRNMKSLLGTKLRKMADKPEDTVFIFFAGHGAPEKDPTSLDGDSISKYIMAHDSDMDDLYTSAIPMNEIARIFSRIRAERIVFISDSCYSGGSGGRTVLASGWRAANISDKFLERIANAGKGRIILTSSSAQEVSQESDDLRHGYFTYYLLEGLKGAADISNDGEVDVDEIYQYLNMRVSDATNGSQHPMKKGEAEGRVIVGRVR